MEHSREKQKPAGKVWLAGAGPGDAGLLTLRTHQLMQEADVAVVDALVSAEILAMIPEGTRIIDVGKRAGRHPVPQEEISQILVREAAAGRKVLRLKGGDPFIFGRGGEELEALAEGKIPFEVIPGVSSSSAVPAYAGIPVTHRDCASSFHVITGHAKQNGTVELDFPALVRLGGTLVFLMGVSSMKWILDGLMEAGMDRNTPAALIARGTTAAQKYLTAEVGTLAEETRKNDPGTPAVIVVGEVCSMAEKFHWAQDRILGGRQFLTTRPRKRSSSLAGILRGLGAQVIEMPAIRTELPEDSGEIRELIRRFGCRAAEEWLLFTSPAGVEYFFDRLREMRTDLRELFRRGASVKIAAIGSATAGELEYRGLIPDVVPEQYCAAALGEAVAALAAPGSRVTAVRAEQASAELFPPIIQAGLTAEDVPLYRTVSEVHPVLAGRISDLLDAGEIDAVTFTSGSTVKGFVRAMGGKDLTGVRAVCIGEQTAEEAGKYGMEVLISDRADILSMADCIIRHFGRPAAERQ